MVALARLFYYDCARSLAHYAVFVALKLGKGNDGLTDEVVHAVAFVACGLIVEFVRSIRW